MEEDREDLEAREAAKKARKNLYTKEWKKKLKDDPEKLKAHQEQQAAYY